MNPGQYREVGSHDEVVEHREADDSTQAERPQMGTEEEQANGHQQRRDDQGTHRVQAQWHQQEEQDRRGGSRQQVPPRCAGRPVSPGQRIPEQQHRWNEGQGAHVERTEDVLDSDPPVPDPGGAPVVVFEECQEEEAGHAQRPSQEDQPPLGAQREGHAEADEQARDIGEQVGMRADHAPEGTGHHVPLSPPSAAGMSRAGG